jgi:4-amino-4-deoxy-L-arabinose transferase-like glycosyltransferase
MVKIMLCKNCNSPLNEGEKFCSNCGAPVTQATEKEIPEQYKPLSPWAYFGLQLLYAVPFVGFIFLIIFSISKGNINRRNFTRSYWCVYILLAVLVLFAVIIYAITGAAISIPAAEAGMAL